MKKKAEKIDKPHGKTPLPCGLSIFSTSFFILLQFDNFSLVFKTATRVYRQTLCAILRHHFELMFKVFDLLIKV